MLGLDRWHQKINRWPSLSPADHPKKSTKQLVKKKQRACGARLISESRMMASGLVHVCAAKADGRWENAYTASEMIVPEDFLAALDDKPKAKQFFETLTKSNRYVIAHGLTSTKKSQTRQRRFAKYIDMLVSEEKPT